MNDIHQHIDDLVRERLQTLPPAAPPPGGWAALQREMDADTDLQLSRALTGLAAGNSPVGWEALQRKMDPRSAADQQLAERLNGLNTAIPTGWEVLAARMDRENDEAVDTIVTDGLALTEPVVTSGWAALAARLELIGWRRSTVAAWKVTEACLLLSLVLLFIRFGPSPYPASTFAELTEGFPLRQLELTGGKEEASSGPKTVVEVTAAVPSPAEETKAVATSETRMKSAVPVVKVSTRSASGVPDQAVAALPATPDASVLSYDTPPSFLIAEADPLREKIYLPGKISALTISDLKTSLYPPSPALTLPRQDDTEPILYYLNIFVSPYDLNEVITPATEIGEVDISPDRRFTYGKSAGILVDAVQGKSALQFGAVYARRSYIPTALKWYLRDEFPIVEPLKGFSRFVYESIDFQLNYKRSLIESSKWRFSGRIGMSMNVVAYSDFIGKDEVIENLNDRFDDFELRSPIDPEISSSGRSSNTADKKRLVDPPNGWWEGGSALENSSLYVNGGFVMERLMNERWSVYVSPSFSRVVYLKKDQGIGPFKDRINPVALRLGSRYHFGGK